MVLELLQAISKAVDAGRLEARAPTTVSPELEARYVEVERELRERRTRDRRDVPTEPAVEG